MAVFRVTAEWSGFAGAPGYTVLHFSAIDTGAASAQAAANAAGAFFTSIKGIISGNTTITVHNSIEVIDEATGQLDDVVSVTAPAPAANTLNNAYSAVSGACITWTTPDTKAGRRVKGRSFIVPLATTAYEPNGTLTSTVLTTLGDAATALRSSTPAFQVWSRPDKITKTGGSAHLVTGHRISDKAAVLRSRRD